MFAYGGGLIVGTDGGWWLPLLANRQITVPPINYGTEKGSIPDYRDWVNTIPEQVQSKGLHHSITMENLKQRGITHVYIGQQHGSVNYAGSNVLDPFELLENSSFRLVYNQDRVWIFEIIY
jgi:hypothetical protein